MPKRVGILTGGGDCPGLNAAIRAVVRRLLPENIETIGILKGWKGHWKRNHAFGRGRGSGHPAQRRNNP